MYKIKMLCYDSDINVRPYDDEPACNGPWETEEEALIAAMQMADDEADHLNEGCDEGISFGVVINETKPIVTVEYYYAESESDTTGNTEIVTVYKIVEFNERNGWTEVK